MDIIDAKATQLAERLADWTVAHVDPAHIAWAHALRAELQEIDGGWSKLRWALGGLSLAWTLRRRATSRGWAALQPRALMHAAAQRRGELLSLSSTVALVALLAFVLVRVLPFYRGYAALEGQPLPLLARIGIGLLELASLRWVQLGTAIVGLYRFRRRRPNRAQLMSGFAVLNLVTVTLLLAYGTIVVDFASRAQEQVAAQERHVEQMRRWESAVIQGLTTARTTP